MTAGTNLKDKKNIIIMIKTLFKIFKIKIF
jgi:hypothetical protein